MADFLTMALLSTEPATATKAVPANPAQTEPAEVDQSFAATLAAEVNGSAPERSQKSASKLRQNTASESNERSSTPAKVPEKAEAKTEDLTAQAAEHPELDTEQAKDQPEQTSGQQAIADEEPAAVDTDAQTEDAESALFNLLEQAKQLQQRLSQNEPEKASTAEFSSEVAAASAELAATSDADPIKLTSNAEAVAKAAESAVKLTSSASGTQIELPEPELTDAASEPLTAEQAEALKKALQLSGGDKHDAALTTKLTSKESVTVTESDSALETELTAESGSDSTKQSISAKLSAGPVTESFKQGVNTSLNSRLSDAEQPQITISYQETAETPQQALAQLLNTVPTAANEKAAAGKVQEQDSAESSDVVAELTADSDEAVNALTEPKLSVQAQSAAALVAPVTAPVKAQQAEAKVSTEEVLKQVAAEQAAAESGEGQESADQQSQQGSTQTLLTEAAQLQSKTVSQAYEQNSFASQLKASIEKAIGTTQTSTTTTFAEQTQKQTDLLAQKLNLIQPEASAQLKEKMLMMVKDKVQTAEIRLDPAELGSMQIKINLQQDQMSVQFIVQQGHAKDLMEQQMPKLRELLQQQGIELSQGSVQQQNQSSSGQGGGRGTSGQTATIPVDGTEEQMILPPGAKRNTDRVVDYYA